jgi:methylisocitrate lyase
MTFRKMLESERAYVAPAVFNPLTARLAEAAGFEVLYLSGGVLGYLKCCLEVNLSLTDFMQVGVEIRAMCKVPLILDGGCGFGDPIHVQHTVSVAEAAGFCAIEIEDQLLPKRVHHYIGIEHMIPQELMVAKVREAVRARRDQDFVIIARTHGVRASGVDDALRRAEAYHEAGANMLYLSPRNPEEARFMADRLPRPFMSSMPEDGALGCEMTLEECGALGYRILTVTTPALAFHRAMQQTYRSLAEDVPNPVLAGTTRKREQVALHHTLNLEALLMRERATVEGKFGPPASG